MTDAEQKTVQEGHTYSSPKGIDYDSVPWRLWDKSKKLFWDPADIDFTQDTKDWASLTGEQQLMLAMSCRGFMVGEEAVTLDILPLLRAMSDMGRLEDTMYLAMFAMEEAKHIDFFRHWFDAVGFDASVGMTDTGGYGGNGGGNGGGYTQGDPFASLQRVMNRLDNDRSPKRILDATLLYNHLIEAVFAIAGYRRFDAQFEAIGQEKLPALRQGLALIQRDERRHIAYGTYLARRTIAENPGIWEWVEQRWHRMAGPLMDGSVEDGIASTLAKRRLDVLAVARTETVADVEHHEIADFEPDEMLETVG
jgi:ribonucleoside-diphosphate reductase beta chain